MLLFTWFLNDVICPYGYYVIGLLSSYTLVTWFLHGCTELGFFEGLQERWFLLYSKASGYPTFLLISDWLRRFCCSSSSAVALSTASRLEITCCGVSPSVSSSASPTGSARALLSLALSAGRDYQIIEMQSNDFAPFESSLELCLAFRL